MHTDAERQAKIEQIRSDFIDRFQNTEVIVALPTPMKPNGDVDYEAVEIMMRDAQKRQIDGVVIGGSTAESATVPRNKMRIIFQTAKKALTNAKGERTVKLIMGTGSSDTQETIKETKWAASMGADAALIITPPVSKPSDEGLIQHFNSIAKAVPKLPIIPYNIMSRTGTNIKPSVVAAIAKENPNIIGIKQSNPDMEQATELVATCPPGFLCLSGDDPLTLPMLSVGFHGVISVAANVPSGYRRIKQMVAAAKTGRRDKAIELNIMLRPLFKACFVDGNPVSIKHLLSAFTAPWMSSTVRPPLAQMNPQKYQDMVKLYRTYCTNENNYRRRETSLAMLQADKQKA